MERFEWEWGSTKHPVIGHAIIGAPIGAVAAWLMLLAGGGPFWAIGAAVLLVVVGFTFQEWADQRAHEAIREHHGGQSPGVWHGWDWKDWVGGVLGALLGGVLVVVLL